MFFALIGASVALLTLSRLHDRELAQLPPPATVSKDGALQELSNR
jgi:hypothetical protein